MIFCSLSRATLLNRLNLDLRRCLVWLKSNYLFFLVYADLCFYSAATALWRRLLDLPFLKEKKKVFSISLFWRIQNNKSFPPFLLFNFRSLSNRLPHQLNFVLLFFTFGFDSFVRAISILNRCQYTHCNWNFIILPIISCFPIILETYFHCGLNVTQ